MNASILPSVSQALLILQQKSATLKNTKNCSSKDVCATKNYVF